MSQIHALINVLESKEISKVKKFRLIGKEKKVLDFIYSYRHNNLPDTIEICETLEMTSTHFYKICSIVLDKIYEELIPNKGYELLSFLNKKGMYSQFIHQALMQENKLIANKTNSKTLEDFYLKTFILMQKVSLKDLDDDMILDFGNKYIKHKKEKNEHDKYFIRCNFLSTKLVLLKVTRKDIDIAKSIGKELLEIEHKLANSTNFLAKFQLNKALSIYYNHNEPEPTKVIIYLEFNKKIIAAHPESFDASEIIFLECKIAEMLYMNSQFGESFEFYSKIFENNQNTLESDFYHHSKYAQLCIILEKYDLAKSIISSKFDVFIESSQSSAGTMGAILYAKLYLFNDPENYTNKYIQTAKKLINKSLFIQYEMEVRILENIYFILKDDHKVAMSLLKKNLKFMNSKGLNLKNSTMIYVCVLLQYAMKQENLQKTLNNRLQGKLNMLQQGYAALYGKLVNKTFAHLGLTTQITNI